jgi:glycosyltransferase involved in cell wall biosynthesis
VNPEAETVTADFKTQPRIAIVQHGDYPAAYETYVSDRPEPYAGMKKTVEAIEGLIANREFLLISLDAPFQRSEHHSGTLMSLPPHKLPRFIPRRIPAAWQRRRVLAEIRRFSPTHLLIRTNGQLAIDLLEYAASRDIECQVIFANVFDPQTRDHAATRRLISLLNQSFVQSVANHLQPAVDSMIECGLKSHKAIAYDVDLPPRRIDRAPKRLKPDAKCNLVFAGNLLYTKGCEDVVFAAAELQRRGIPVHLSIYGDGPHKDRLQQIAAKLPAGLITIHGRQPNTLIVQAMRESTLVCVTTHRQFPEGMPLTLTEALATRSPVIASTHPVFLRAFQDGEGLRFVPEKQSVAIADAVEQLWNDPAEYCRLSESTSQALERVKCNTPMSSLLKEWSETFEGVCS